MWDADCKLQKFLPKIWVRSTNNECTNILNLITTTNTTNTIITICTSKRRFNESINQPKNQTHTARYNPPHNQDKRRARVSRARRREVGLSKQVLRHQRHYHDIYHGVTNKTISETNRNEIGLSTKAELSPNYMFHKVANSEIPNRKIEYNIYTLRHDETQARACHKSTR